MASIDNSEHGMPRRSGIADLIVKGAIALITAAFFIGAYLQFQMSFWVAFLGALGVYLLLIMVHALMRRRERESALVHELSRLEGEVARLKVAPPQARAAAGAPRAPKLAMPPAAGAPATPAGAPVAARPPVAAPPPVPTMPAPATGAKPPRAPLGERPPRMMPHRSGQPMDAPPRSEPMLPVPPAAGQGLPLRAEPPAADLPPVPTLPDWSAPPAAPGMATDNRLHDYWPTPSRPSLPEAPRAELPPLPSERETDLDAVQGMIKRLADEVDIGAEPALDGLPPLRQESMLRASLNALQTTASVMRATKKKDVGLPGFTPAPATRGSASMPPVAPPPIMPSHTRLAALAEAVGAGRIDVALSPIVGLADHQLHYFEIVATPRDERGTLLSVAVRDPQLAIAGLLPLLDRARLARAAQLARTLAEQGRATCLFTSVSAASLVNDGFLDELAEVYRERESLAGELVLTFNQADVRTFGGSEWSALTDMRDLGFRFGVEGVADFDYEFTALCAAGFAFVKADAATLLAGLAAPGGAMSAEDVCRSLSDLGLTLVASNIGDEETRNEVLAAGVPLGEGILFGAPGAAGNAFAAAGDAAA